MIFKTNGFYAYCITETDEGCIINDSQGFVMEAEQMIELANKMIRYAKKNTNELKQHNIQRQKEIEQELSSFKNTPKPKQKAYVYVFECGGFYKIGYSKDVKRRIKELDNRPHKVNVVCVSRYLENAYDIEQKLHEELKRYRLEGEWYDLPDNVLLTICKHIKRQV